MAELTLEEKKERVKDKGSICKYRGRRWNGHSRSYVLFYQEVSGQPKVPGIIGRGEKA